MLQSIVNVAAIISKVHVKAGPRSESELMHISLVNV